LASFADRDLFFRDCRVVAGSGASAGSRRPTGGMRVIAFPGAAMNVLILGGTGVISTGIVKHLVARGARVTVLTRGLRESALPPEVVRLSGDRSDLDAVVARQGAARFDAVIDMICFATEQAEETVRAFRGRCAQLLFCSTVCTYGVKSPPGVLVDETFPQEPVTPYATNKLECERVFLRAADAGAFAVTIVRPSHTYGPGGPLLDQIEIDGVAWDRVLHGLPVLCSGDGLGLWQSTHRDDVGKLFAYAALNPRAYGEAYNATRDAVLTWRDYHREVAQALERRADLVFAPASFIVRELEGRAAFLAEVSGFHGAYSSAKAKAHVPEFDATVGLVDGAAETFADLRRRGKWRSGATDAAYQRAVDRALALGFPITAA
jgi:nucleoside-diphosphate-sugar epimerase